MQPPNPAGAVPAHNVKHAWTAATTDSKGLTSKKCRITVTKDDGTETVFIVTARYNIQDLQKRGFTGDVENTVKDVIDATIDIFPDLAGSSISFNPNKPEETLITKHTTADYSGKKLEYLKAKDVKLFSAISKVSNLFEQKFKFLIPPIQLTVEEEKKALPPAPLPPSSVSLDVEEEKNKPTVGFEPLED